MVDERMPYLVLARRAAHSFARKFGGNYPIYKSAAQLAVIENWDKIRAHPNPRALTSILVRRYLYVELENIPLIRVPRTSYRRKYRAGSVGQSVPLGHLLDKAPADMRVLYDYCATDAEREAVRDFIQWGSTVDTAALEAVANRVAEGHTQ